MNETEVMLQGWLGTDVTEHSVAGATVAKFRVASTPRRYRRSTDEWVDGTTQWYAVSAWRTLGEHCARSLRRGDPVFVQGRLSASTWINRDNVEITTYEVEALLVGHDLNRGVSQFTRVKRDSSQRSADQAQSQTADQTGSQAQAGTPEPAAGAATQRSDPAAA